MDKVKRDRSANFSIHETDILVSLLRKYQTVLENKQSGASTWKLKEAAWESIQKEFNTRCGGFRSTKTLKIKYEGLKRTVRKKSAASSELYTAPLDNAEEQIKAMITLSTDDNALHSFNSTSNESWDVTSKMNLKSGQHDPLIENALHDTTSNESWDVISRRNLKSGKQYDALNAHRSKETLFVELAQAKLKLVQLQKEFLEAELIEKKKVWEFEQNERKKESEFKEKERKWKEEEYKIKLRNNFK